MDYVSRLAELWVHLHGVDAGQASFGEECRVSFLATWYPDISEAGRVEVVQLSDVPLLDSPRFTAIQQCGENHNTVDLNICLCCDARSVPHVLVQSAES